MFKDAHNVVILTAALAAFAPPCPAEVAMQTNRWTRNQEGFDAFSRRIQSMELRNLLAREGVKAHTREAPPNVNPLTDSHGGTIGEEGRVFLQGKPSVIAYYLGKPKTVTEVGVLGFNWDTRANQDYEVRLADNSARPREMPRFDGPPQLTTGETIIGANGGGFHSYFRNKAGGPLVPGKVDWVEFRIWRTYNVKAGEPGESKTCANSATVVRELEVLGTEGDILVLTPEEIARRKALREAPRKPPYEKKATWQETMVAAREAIVQWETELDKLMLPESGVRLGPWHAMGPFAADSPEARHISRERDLDVTNAVALKVGQETRTLAWTPATAIEDGQLADVADRIGGEPGLVVFLCRTLECDHEFNRSYPSTTSVSACCAGRSG